MRILVFGTGDYYQRYKNFISDEIVGFIDNNVVNVGKIIDGHLVLTPSEGIKIPYDNIYILSVYWREMQAQLLLLWVDIDRTFSPVQVEERILKSGKKIPVKYIGSDVSALLGSSKKNVAMLTPDLKLNGATVALLSAVKACAENGYKVVVAAIIDGDAEENFVNAGAAAIIIDKNLLFEKMSSVAWLKGFEFVLCNTVLYYRLLINRNKKIPIMWWLHDPPYVYENIDSTLIKEFDFSNLYVYGAGRIATDSFRYKFGNIQPEILQFGINDTCTKVNYNKSDLYSFISVGEIQNWKGMDLFAEAAFEILNSDAGAECDFRIIGNDQTKLAEILKKKYGSDSRVIFDGICTRTRMEEKYEQADVYVCASRQETMSITVVEAMMHEIPCIVSDAAGIADYIENGINGLLFSSEDLNGLRNKMIWCLNHKKEATEIGKKGRQIYEKYFSEKVFKNNLLSILAKVRNG